MRRGRIFLMRWVSALPLSTVGMGIAWSMPAAAAPEAQRVDFARDVLPIFQAQCIDCHGPQKQKGDLRLDQKTAELAKIVKANDLAGSELYRRVTLPKGDEDVMPNRGEPLTANQVAVIRRWIEQGAVWPEGVKAAGHW